MGITKAEYDLKIGTGELDRQLVGAGMRTGVWYKPPSGTTTTIPAEAQIQVSPIVVARPCTLDRIVAEVTVAGTAGALVRLGIWHDRGDTYPGLLALDAGTIDGTSATVQALTISLPIKAGLYWVGGCVQGAAGTRPTMRTYNGSFPQIGDQAATPGFTSSHAGFTQASITGAFPSQFTSTVIFTGAPIAAMIRASA